MKPVFKPPGTKRIKQNCVTLHSTYAFKFNLSRYTRAGDIVIMSKPVRQGVLFECLTQLHAEGGGLHSFPFQLNLSSSVHCNTQINS
jgi:hypothetical protein